MGSEQDTCELGAKRYKLLTMREAYDLYAVGVEVERYWIAWMPISECYGGGRNLEEFAECYSCGPYKFRVEVE